MDFRPANGWCSTSCRLLSTFFIRTSGLSTASKTYGAMRLGYNGKRQRLVDQRLWRAATLIRRAFHQSRGLDVLRLLGGQSRHNYFGDGADGGVPFDAAGGVALGAPAGPGVGGGLASRSSTSKIRVAFGPISGLTERSPYARLDGIHN
jgi:hypothetical protein